MKESFKVTPLFNMFEYVLRRKSMFGIESVNDLYTFYLGYTFCLVTNGIKDSDYDQFEKFNDYVKLKCEISIEQHWGNIICFSSGSNAHSLEKFSTLLLEFRQSLIK